MNDALSIVEDGVTVVEIADLDLHLRFVPLLFGRVAISQAKIESLDLALQVEDGGRLNLTRLAHMRVRLACAFTSKTSRRPSTGAKEGRRLR